MELLKTLNDKQRQAVTAARHPMMILAGPGTGKTRTLVARILYLIHHDHIPPHAILAVTFTNKAKEEMHNRLRDELGDAASDLTIGTFHRYCLDVLRTDYHDAGLPKQFTIADETTQLMTLSRASRIQDERSLRTVLTAISSYRINPKNLNPAFQGIARKWLMPYHEELRKNGLIDFDQIILRTRALFAQSPELVAQQQRRFLAILIDEFQDTDPMQYDIMSALAQQHRNIFAVADDDQSIFAWRGANIGNIERFIKEFDCRQRVIVLDQNYRSAQCIIDIAAQLLDEHRMIEKTLRAVPLLRQPVLRAEHQFCPFDNDDDEINFILAQIQGLTQSNGDSKTTPPLRYADIAILYPNHAIGEKLETRLLAANIPCQLVKRQGIFDEQDVQKILLLCKLLQNPEDDVTLEHYFKLEFANDLVFQQLVPLKSEFPTFKQTLAHAAEFCEFSGISRHHFRNVVHTCFGTISNLISYLEQNLWAVWRN